MRKDNDIKAPDGFLLGGLRRVRSNGTILFQRGWWQAPKEWAGKDVWVHWNADCGVDAAPPGMHIFEARYRSKSVDCPRTKRPDAKAGYRLPAHKAWANRP